MKSGALARGGPAERQERDPASPWWGEHESRYRSAAPEVRGKVVLDAACGTGFGVGILAGSGPALVVGLDLDPVAVADAVRAFGGSRTRVVQGDVGRLPFARASFDVVTTFETIEHVPDVRSCLREFRRVLKPGGVLLCSTPNRAVTSPDGIIRNPFHVREFSAPELAETLGEVFEEVRLLGQRCRRDLTGSRPARLMWRGLCMRGIRKLPFAFRDRVSRALTGRALYPQSEEFAFVSDLAGAPTLVGVCRTSGDLAPTHAGDGMRTAADVHIS